MPFAASREASPSGLASSRLPLRLLSARVSQRVAQRRSTRSAPEPPLCRVPPPAQRTPRRAGRELSAAARRRRVLGALQASQASLGAAGCKSLPEPLGPQSGTCPPRSPRGRPGTGCCAPGSLPGPGSSWRAPGWVGPGPAAERGPRNPFPRARSPLPPAPPRQLRRQLPLCAPPAWRHPGATRWASQAHLPSAAGEPYRWAAWR